jgi:hypothetical protein
MVEAVTRLVERVALLAAVSVLIAVEFGYLDVSDRLEAALWGVAGWTILRPEELMKKAKAALHEALAKLRSHIPPPGAPEPIDPTERDTTPIDIRTRRG